MITIQGVIELLSAYNTAARSFIEQYTVFGRHMLDFLYIIFNNLFNVFLVLAVIISAFYLFMTIYTSLARKKYEEEPFDADNAPFVTVQIPTYNELVALNCASRCLEFDYPKDSYEILIGDDSSDAEVSKKIAEFAAKHSMVKVAKRENNLGFKPGNLNNMIKHSRGEIFVIFDSDFLPEKDFLKRIVNPMIKDNGISAVQARWGVVNPNDNLVTRLGTAICAGYHYIILPFISSVARISSLCGSAEAIRRDILLKLGPWQSGSLTEDIEFSLKLLASGHRILYLPELECNCEVPFTGRDLYKQQMRWAYGVIHSFKEHLYEILAARMGIAKKLCILSIGSGYLIPVLLLFLFIFGALSFITHAPGPVDLPRFFSDLAINVLLTSGLLVASTVAVLRSRHTRRIDLLLASSFSYGLAVTYFVNKGIFKVIFRQPMHWYMLNKAGNRA